MVEAFHGRWSRVDWVAEPQRRSRAIREEIGGSRLVRGILAVGREAAAAQVELGMGRRSDADNGAPAQTRASR
jgi:hypothetical protein